MSRTIRTMLGFNKIAIIRRMKWVLKKGMPGAFTI